MEKKQLGFLETAVCAVIMRTYFYFEDTGRKNSFERFPYLHMLSGRVTVEDAEAWRKDTGPQARRYFGLLRAIGGGQEEDGVLRTVLDLCLAAMYVPEFAGYLNYYTGNGVTVQLAFEMEGDMYPQYAKVVDALHKLQKICRVDWKRSPLFYAALEGDHLLIAYLMGDGKGPELFRRSEWFLCDEDIDPMRIREDLPAFCVRRLEESGGVLQIAGAGGRRFLAKHTAKQMGKDILLVEAQKFRLPLEENDESYASELAREVFFGQGLVCIYGLEDDWLKERQMGAAEFFTLAVRPFLNIGIPVILCTGMRVRFLESRDVRVSRVELEETTREERETLFRAFFNQYGVNLDSKRCSVRYRLSASEIAKAAERWRRVQEMGEPDAASFSKICYEILCIDQESAFGKVVSPNVLFSDLILPEKEKALLGQICCAALEGVSLYEEWGIARQYPYGRAVSVLLAGPPGTGKTMSAYAIAKEIGIPLYQVDLSGIMDKYIGETEKHLEQVFAFAEKTNLALFFDEADSLFGKRGASAEGKDRYANMEVSYILQRIEQFDGIVILATNFYSNIDKAFIRRMKYVIKYREPDEGLRSMIWKGCLPPERKREDVDIPYLARQFDFTGGMIKNVVLNACVKAVYEGELLGMGHLLQAVQEEYEKMGRVAGRDLWKEYAHLMDDGEGSLS